MKEAMEPDSQPVEFVLLHDEVCEALAVAARSGHGKSILLRKKLAAFAAMGCGVTLRLADAKYDPARWERFQ